MTSFDNKIASHPTKMIALVIHSLQGGTANAMNIPTKIGMINEFSINIKTIILAKPI